MGVALESEAAPPLIVKVKSPFSRSPLPLLVLYTASDIVTATEVLSLDTLTAVMVAGALSLRFAVLLLCVVLEMLSKASYIELAAGLTFSTSAPSGVPTILRPNV